MIVFHTESSENKKLRSSSTSGVFLLLNLLDYLSGEGV